MNLQIFNNNISLHLFAGGSASGKTTIAREVHELLLKNNIHSLLISQDDYTICNKVDVKIKDITNYNFDTPYAIDTKHLFNHITTLLEGEEVLMPKYYFGDKPKEYDKVKSGTPNIILVEGTFILYYKYLVDLAHTTFFIDVEEEIRLERRINRDIKERNITQEKTIERFNMFVKPSHDEFIQPSSKNASCIIKDNKYNLEEVVCTIIHKHNQKKS